jgi:glycogen debranching enzyme
VSTRQPLLHELIATLAAPTQILSSSSGDIVSMPDQENAQGLWHGDVRVLSAALVEVNGATPEHIATRIGSSAATFTALVRNVGEGQTEGHDPQVRLDRLRAVAPNQVREEVTISSVLPQPTDVSLSLTVASDGAAMDAVKLGHAAQPRPFIDQREPSVFQWSIDELSVSLSAPGATFALADDRAMVSVRWDGELPSHGTFTCGWSLQVTDQMKTVIPAPEQGALEVERLVQSVASRLQDTGIVDKRIEPWLTQSLADLNGLRMAIPDTPEDAFFAAGVPWYLTLFGRDSIWTARLLLSLDVGHAAGTLRTLAHFQGTTADQESAQAPGKIMHELRRAQFAAAGAASLPPRYYGTIDATPLWICLLHDAWQQGMPDEEVAALLPNLQGALEWMRRYGDADGDGFLEYIDESGHGLANQGWKDSIDSIRFADGETAVGPVALCEVQGYAYEAAVKGAALLDAFGLPEGDSWREWAKQLADRFRSAFWCQDGKAKYPALALDSNKRPVDSLTSNIGHLLGTGLLSAEEELVVAKLLTSPSMDSGLGLRTMSSQNAAYSPLSYHCGSVWPHDTAIVILGMVRAGLSEYANGLVEGLLQASTIFDQRLPELWSGEGLPGVPYPAACRPQAWSAAAAVAVIEALMAGVSAS